MFNSKATYDLCPTESAWHMLCIKDLGVEAAFAWLIYYNFSFWEVFSFPSCVYEQYGWCKVCLFVKLSVVVDNSNCTVWFEFIVGSLSLIVNSLEAVKTQTRTYKFCRAPVDSARLSCRSQHESWGTSQPMERPVDAWTCVGADFAIRTERF